MKKYFLSLGLIMVAMFTLTNCTEQIDAPVEPAKVPFEIIASTVETKTAAGDNLSTVWTEGDALNVFHIVSGGTEYQNDGKFGLSGDNVFKGELSETLTEEVSYNWYAFYPYSSYMVDPIGTKGYMVVGSEKGESQTQKGYDSMEHIAGENYPLAGVSEDCEFFAGDPIEITMSHLTSLLEIVVTNKNDEELIVETVSFTGTENIVGTYYINFTEDPVVYTSSGGSYVSKVANLNVENGTSIVKNANAKFYIAIKPFTAAKNSKLRLSVNGYSKEITLAEAVTFSAGKVKTLNFAYDEVKLPSHPIPWSEDFSSGDISSYKLVHGESDTKIYEDGKLAGGEAPELLIGRNGGSFMAKLATDDYVGDLTLLFKSNYPDRIAVCTSTPGITITKVSNVEYTLNVEESVSVFDLEFTNTTSDNTRIDNIELVEGILQTQELTFDVPSYSFEWGSTEANEFIGQTVKGAKTTVVYSSSNTNVAEVDPETGVVTLKEAEGSATITATAASSAQYKEATAEYLISISLPTTGESKTYTLEITTSDFNSSSYAANNGEHTSIATSEDGSTFNVTWTSNQVMYQNSVMQWQKSKGYIYNTTNLGTIDSIELVNNTGGTFTINKGNTPQPTDAGEGGYFKISVGAATGKIDKIIVTFTK